MTWRVDDHVLNEFINARKTNRKRDTNSKKKQGGSGTEILIRIHQKCLVPDSMNTDSDQCFVHGLSPNKYVLVLYHFKDIILSYTNSSYLRIVKTHLHNYFLTSWVHALNFYHNVYIAVHATHKIQYDMYPIIKIISKKLLPSLFCLTPSTSLLRQILFFPLFPLKDHIPSPQKLLQTTKKKKLNDLFKAGGGGGARGAGGRAGAGPAWGGRARVRVGAV
jgi:hypothetical protein